MTTKANRETGYDVLRLAACLGVIVMHIRLDKLPNVSFTPEQVAVAVAIGGMACFAVPVFFILSGAFLLEKRETADFGRFYRQSFCKLGIPTLLFSALYVLFEYGLLLAAPPSDKAAWIAPIKGLLLGAPGSILWFMYTLLGLYAIAPLLARLKAGMTSRQFAWLGIIAMVLGSITKASVTFKLHWGMTFLLYTGYFILGNVIYETFSAMPRPWHVPRAALLGGGIALCLGMGFYVYWYILGKVPEGIWELGDKIHPISAIAGLLLVAGATAWKKPWKTAGLSALTYEVYLWHWAVAHFVMGTIAKTKLIETPAAAAIVCVLLTAIISLGLARLTHPLLAHLGKRCNARLTARSAASASKKKKHGEQA